MRRIKPTRRRFRGDKTKIRGRGFAKNLPELAIIGKPVNPPPGVSRKGTLNNKVDVRLHGFDEASIRLKADFPATPLTALLRAITGIPISKQYPKGWGLPHEGDNPYPGTPAGNLPNKFWDFANTGDETPIKTLHADTWRRYLEKQNPLLYGGVHWISNGNYPGKREKETPWYELTTAEKSAGRRIVLSFGSFDTGRYLVANRTLIYYEGYIIGESPDGRNIIGAAVDSSFSWMYCITVGSIENQGVYLYRKPFNGDFIDDIEQQWELFRGYPYHKALTNILFNGSGSQAAGLIEDTDPVTNEGVISVRYDMPTGNYTNISIGPNNNEFELEYTVTNDTNISAPTAVCSCSSTGLQTSEQEVVEFYTCNKNFNTSTCQPKYNTSADAASVCTPLGGVVQGPHTTYEVSLSGDANSSQVITTLNNSEKTVNISGELTVFLDWNEDTLIRGKVTYGISYSLLNDDNGLDEYTQTNALTKSYLEDRYTFPGTFNCACYAFVESQNRDSFRTKNDNRFDDETLNVDISFSMSSTSIDLLDSDYFKRTGYRLTGELSCSNPYTSCPCDCSNKLDRISIGCASPTACTISGGCVISDVDINNAQVTQNMDTTDDIRKDPFSQVGNGDGRVPAFTYTEIDFKNRVGTDKVTDSSDFGTSRAVIPAEHPMKVILDDMRIKSVETPGTYDYNARALWTSYFYAPRHIFQSSFNRHDQKVWVAAGSKYRIDNPNGITTTGGDFNPFTTTGASGDNLFVESLGII